VLLIDKTGTLTLGKPKIIDFKYFDDQISSRFSESDLLQLAGTAERYSEHPWQRRFARRP